VIAEYIFAYDHTSPEHIKGVWEVIQNMGAVPWLMGGGLWTVGRDPLTPNITGNFYDAAKKFKRAVDKNNIMNPHIGFAEF